MEITLPMAMMTALFHPTKKLSQELHKLREELKQLNEQIEKAQYDLDIASGKIESAVPYQAHEETRRLKILQGLESRRNKLDKKFNRIFKELETRKERVLAHQ